jgi:hypothetical protein
MIGASIDIDDYVTTHKITEVLHFTTNSGILGILGEKALLPRSELKASQTLEFILHNNCDVRKDPEWTGHNSMSLTKINSSFFSFSERRHAAHADLWWCILSFKPDILSHGDVVFVSGNNTWPGAVKSKGLPGLKKMFAATVPGRYGSTIFRSPGVPINQPTSIEAEVLYPGKLRALHRV